MIGIFGGTFDPPHLGHSILAVEAAEALELERLLWVLTASPPHKKHDFQTPVEDRLDMVSEAVKYDDRFELSRADIDRPAPHYALGTVQWLKEKYPGTKFLYLVGGDSLRDLGSWYRVREFIQGISALGVMRRPGAAVDMDNLERQIPGIGEKTHFLNAPMVDISATEIRKRAATGKPYRHLVLPEVAEIIQSRGLYTQRESRGD